MLWSMGDLSALVDLVASGAGPGAVAGWLEEAAGCTAVLAAGAEPPPAAPAAPPGAALSALSAGRTADPLEAGGGGQQVLVVPVGVMSPRPLLWAWRAAGWDERGREAAVRAAGVGATLAAAAKAAVGAAATMAGRIAGWQALMAGDVVRAARTLAPLVPQLVPAGAGQVGVLEVPAGADRLTAAREVDHLLEGHGALVVTYPVDDRQIIIVMPGSRLLEDLEPVLGHGRAAGVSVITPWQQTPSAYRGAVEALAQARGQREQRITQHEGRAPLVELLHADARIWAELVLQPLREELEPADREALLALAADVIWWGEDAAAPLVGWHPKTLARHMNKLADLTGYDRRRLWPSVALQLAVQLAALPPPPVMAHRPTLAEALDVDRVRQWAQDIVGPLPRLVREAAVAWVRSDGDAEAALAILGRSRTTLYRRLNTARELTRLEITRYPGAGAELALALYVAGDLPMGTLPSLRDRHLTARGQGGEPMVEIDTEKPHPARVYNYLCGGGTNYAPDRRQGQRMLEYDRNAAAAAQANRQFLLRAAEFVAASGVQQVLDLGSGIPMAPNIHDVMLRAVPDGRVVYVDSDPIVLAHAAELLAGTPSCQIAYSQADVTIGGAALLDLPEVAQTLDLDKPVALAAVALLHFLPGEPGPRLIADLMDRLAPGSMLIVSHLTADFNPEFVTPGVEQYNATVAPLCTRTRDEVADLFDGLELLDPGIVPTPEWKPCDEPPHPTPEQVNCWVGVARK